MSYTQAYSGLPISIQNMIKEIVRIAQPQHLILFGSRARGDHRENSDYDIAVKGRKCSDHEWTRLMIDFEEGLWTLLPVDIVEYEKLNHEYHKNIDREGVVLYE